MQPDIGDPSVSLGVDGEPVWHIEPAGAPLLLGHPLVLVQDQHRLLLDHLPLLQPIVGIKAPSIPDNRAAVEDDRVIVVVYSDRGDLSQGQAGAPAVDEDRMGIFTLLRSRL